VNLPDLVVGKISDSAFISIPGEIAGIASLMKFPAVFVPAAVWFLKKKVIQIADFDLSRVSPLKSVASINCPTVFGHAEADQFVPFSHMRQLYNASKHKEKFLMILDGSHNSRRDISWLTLGVSFALERFGILTPNLEVCEARCLQEKIAHFDSFNAMVENVRKREEGSVSTDELLEHMDEVRIEQKSLAETIEMPEDEGSVRKKKRRRKRTAEVQTEDIFGLPPIQDSARTPLPEPAEPTKKKHSSRRSGGRDSTPESSQVEDPPISEGLAAAPSTPDGETMPPETGVDVEAAGEGEFGDNRTVSPDTGVLNEAAGEIESVLVNEAPTPGEGETEGETDA
jgi:hypothetical protein